MAAPTIRGSVIPAIVTNGDVSITSPSATAIGDLLIFFLWTQGSDSTTITHTEKAGFFRWFSHGHNDGTTDGRLTVCAKKATNGGAISYTPWAVANGTANQSSLGLIVITTGTYQFNYDSVAPTIGTAATQTSNAVPNPPQVTGLTGDFLILAIGAWHVTTAGSTQATASTNYAIEIQNANASHVTHLAVERRALTGLSAATEDPAAFGDNVTPNGSAIQTIALRAPAAVLSGQLNVGGGGAADVAASTRTAFGGSLAIDGGGSVVIADSTVGGGAVEHFSGQLDVSGAGTPAIAASTRNAIGGALAVGGGVTLAVASSSRQTFGASAISGDGSVAVATSTRTTTSSLSVVAAGQLDVVASNRQAFSAINIGSTAVLVVAASVRETFGAAAVSADVNITITDSAVEPPDAPEHLSGVLSLTALGYVGVRKAKVATHGNVLPRRSPGNVGGLWRASSTSWTVRRRR